MIDTPETQRARSKVADLLEVSVLDGLVDDEHTDKLAEMVVTATLEALGLGAQWHVSVSRVGQEGMERMQAQGRDDSHAMADRLARDPDVALTTCHHRWCSPWHRTT